MSLTMRIILLLTSLLTGIWVMKKIRKSQVILKDAVFWLLSAALLVLMSIFPGAVEWATALIGVQSPVNFVFLAIIFVLLIKVFLLSIRISQLEYKIQVFVQKYAIHHAENSDPNEGNVSK